MRQLNYAQAIIEHETVLRFDPSHITTYYDLGYIHFLRGDASVRELVAEGQPAIQTTLLFTVSSTMYAKELEFTEARTALEQSIALDSTDAATYVDLRRLRLSCATIAPPSARAVEASVPPLEKEAYFVLANALRRLGKGEESGLYSISLVRWMHSSTRLKTSCACWATIPTITKRAQCSVYSTPDRALRRGGGGLHAGHTPGAGQPELPE